RRVIAHFKKQEWTAIFLDFVIVVIGVFVGMQVNNWNEAREDRGIEAQYLERLQQELAEMAPQADAVVQETIMDNERISEVRDYFMTGENGDDFGGAHCAALARSHIFADVIFYPPTIKELISTGRIVLIRDDALRTAILAFDQVNEEISQLRDDIQIDRLPLARKHPDLIRVGLVNWEGSACDFPAMAANQSFINDFSDNRSRFAAYVASVLERQATIINALGNKVALSRGIEFKPANESVGEPDSASAP
ncbi:MAG TPA: hypothetical protein DEA50_10395, partial [Parvularcula sp.]|nr:hypothetical protein [Parvularcula sp.]